MVSKGSKGRGQRVGETLRSRPLKEDNKALRAEESRSKKFEKTWNTINSSFSSRQQETMRAVRKSGSEYTVGGLEEEVWSGEESETKFS